MNLLRKLQLFIYATVVFSLLSGIFLCIQVKKNNPMLPDYQGDYRLTVLPTLLPDTLRVFHSYAAVCSTGADTFSTYRVSGAAASAIAVDRVRKGRPDSIIFHCIGTFDGFAKFEGVCPNGKTVGDSVNVHIVNPYSIIGDSVAVVNETSQYRIARPLADTPVAGISVIWTSGGVRDSMGLDSAFSFKPVNGQPLSTVSAVIEDTSDHSLALTPAYVRVIASVRPVLSIAAMNGSAMLGKPLTITIILSNADTSSYRVFAVNGLWRDSSSLKPLNTRDTISLSRIVTDMGPATFTIFVVNSSGLKSNEIVIADTIQYSLPVITFPKDSQLVSLNDSFPVTVSSAPAAMKYTWSIDLIRSDTTTSPNFKVLLTDTLFHTLTVSGIVQYGQNWYSGKPASIIIYARPFEYVIQPAAFPLDVKAKSWAQWIAGVSNPAHASEKNAKYTWTVFPQNYDSVKYGGAANDTMWLYWKDSAHAIITLTVSDTAGVGCAPYAKSVSVRRYAPDLAFKEHVVSAKTTDDIILVVSAADSSAGGAVDSIFWRRGGKSVAHYVSKDSVWVVRSAMPDTFWVSAYCRDNDGFLSNKDSVLVLVKAFQPYFQPAMADTIVFINAPDTFTVHAHVSDTTAAIAKYFWDFDGNGTWDDSTAAPQATHTFSLAGATNAIVKCRDSKGMESASDTFKVSVSNGGPVVSGITPDTCWIKDTVSYTINAREVNPTGAIVSYGIAWDGQTVFTQYIPSSTMKTAFATNGMNYVRIFAEDNNAISSDTVTDSVFVKADIPVVDSIRVDSIIFVLDTRAFTVSAHGLHTAIDSFKIFWGGSSSVSGTGTFSHSFPTAESGSRAIKAIVKNHNGYWSDTLTKNMTVRLGRPKMLGISKDSAIVYARDPVNYTISANDTNGTIKQWFLAWDSIDGFSEVIGGKVQTTFLNAGIRNVRAYVIDDDGLVSDTLTWQLAVHSGAPVIDSVTIDASANNIFVRDNRIYTVFAHDTNGTVKMIYAAWNNGANPTDSVVAANGFGQFTHAYDTSLSGPRIARFWVKDNDTIMSSSKDTTILVRLAPPVLWGDNPTKDTVWTIINNGYGINYNVHINSYDTNGTISRYYWNEAGSFDSTTATKTNDSLYSRLIGINDVNHAFPIWIYGRDDDGLVRGRQFIAFADSVPPAPVTTIDKPTGQIRIGWIGKDVKDGNGTMFKILLKQGSAPASTDVLIDFTSGTSLSPGQNGYDFSYTFIPSGGNGTYYYQVIAKDARGSISFNSASFFNFP